MKVLSFTVVTLGVLCNGARAEEPVAQPTPFEAFASKPSARVVFSLQVGSIDSAGTKVSVTALVADDIEHPDQMRGVRFDLENNVARDQVYLDEAQLRVVKRDLGWMEQGIPRLESDTSAPYRVQGTQGCWLPKHPVRILCPEYYIRRDRTGLKISAYGGRIFTFPDRKPSELAGLIDQAMTALARR